MYYTVRQIDKGPRWSLNNVETTFHKIVVHIQSMEICEKVIVITLT